MARNHTTIGSLLMVSLWAYSRPVSACNERSVCVYWNSEISDNDVGEDYLIDDDIRARGARVTLMRPVPEPPISTFLDENGCLSFETQYAYGHKLLVYADAWIGTTDPVRIYAQRQETIDGPIETDFVWIVDLQGLAPDDTVTVPIKADATDPIAPLMAIATATMYRLSEEGLLPAAPPSMYIQYLDWKGNARFVGSGIQVGPDSFREKFLVAHEIGHWLQWHWGGEIGDSTEYGYKPMDDPCKFGVVKLYDFMDNELPSDASSHGLRSAEWSTPAMSEGFAHLIATAVFNDYIDPGDNTDEDGIFRYYKDIDVKKYDDYQAFAEANSRVSLLGDGIPPLGGELRWTENQCPNDWAEQEVSTELDWMRLFWHILTRSGTPPTLKEMLEFLNFIASSPNIYAVDHINVWCEIRDAVDDSPVMGTFAARFDQANIDTGVYNGICPP